MTDQDKTQEVVENQEPQVKAPQALADDQELEYRANGEVRKVTLAELKKRAALAEGAEKALQEAAEAKKVVALAEKAIKGGDWESEKALYRALGMSAEEVAAIEAYRADATAPKEGSKKAKDDDEDEDPAEAPITRQEYLQMQEEAARREIEQTGRKAMDDMFNLVEELVDKHPEMATIERQYGKNEKGRKGFVNRWDREAKEKAYQILQERLNSGERFSPKWIKEAAQKAVNEEFAELRETLTIGGATRGIGRAPDTGSLEDIGDITKAPSLKPAGKTVTEEELSDYLKKSLKHAVLVKESATRI